MRNSYIGYPVVIYKCLISFRPNYITFWTMTQTLAVANFAKTPFGPLRIHSTSKKLVAPPVTYGQDKLKLKPNTC